MTVYKVGQLTGWPSISGGFSCIPLRRRTQFDAQSRGEFSPAKLFKFAVSDWKGLGSREHLLTNRFDTHEVTKRGESYS